MNVDIATGLSLLRLLENKGRIMKHIKITTNDEFFGPIIYDINCYPAWAWMHACGSFIPRNDNEELYVL